MVEVFKTNVTEPAQAVRLVRLIHQTFRHYQASFDLEDCDRILRVQCAHGCVEAAPLITLLKKQGFYITVLPDEVRPVWNEANA